jgi:hypothetical protein
MECLHVSIELLKKLFFLLKKLKVSKWAPQVFLGAPMNLVTLVHNVFLEFLVRIAGVSVPRHKSTFLFPYSHTL